MLVCTFKLMVSHLKLKLLPEHKLTRGTVVILFSLKLSPSSRSGSVIVCLTLFTLDDTFPGVCLYGNLDS